MPDLSNILMFWSKLWISPTRRQSSSTPDSSATSKNTLSSTHSNYQSKKLSSDYVIRSLQKVTDAVSQTKSTSLLLTKAIKYGRISDSALTLLNHTPLHKN